MKTEDFKKNGLMILDWMDEYFQSVQNYPVLPDVKPGDVKAGLPLHPPPEAESMQTIFSDFKNIIVPGMTHWQHPQFFAYFPASRSEPSVLAEMLTATMGAQCMIWLTSPAAEELEERMMEWLRSMYSFPAGFTGVIQDTASTAALVTLLTAREVKSGFAINQKGFNGTCRFRVYASDQAHSSIDKAVRMAGIGHDNLIKINSDERYAMNPQNLDCAIQTDIQEGFTPLAVVGTFGTTSSTAIDPLADIGKIAKQHNCWYHVDAAFAGNALILPEIRSLAAGIELADTIVVNPHKWMLTNFDCTAYFVKDKQSLIKTFSITPEYLKTGADDQVNNYRDWGIQLGRRFRALKLWFVIRNYGVKGLQDIISNHITIAHWLEQEIAADPDYELMAPVNFGLVCFRYHPENISEESELNALNEKLLSVLNKSGKIFLTHTKLNNRYTIRLVGGNSNTRLEDVQIGWKIIKDTCLSMRKEPTTD